MKKNEFELLNYIRKNGKKSYRDIQTDIDLSIGTISSIVSKFEDSSLVDETGITQKGLEELKPYKVNNAIILSAGPSSRFVPLSLELPKGLFKVRDDVLIERQIRQLKEAGIDDITIVLGYKKELFFYLKDKYDVNFVINTDFNRKNNIESLYLARHKISSTYICSCDDYFVDNPFDQYEFDTFYASINTSEKTNEMYVKTNNKGEIISMKKGLPCGDILLGHAFFSKEFSSEFIKLIEEVRATGEYDKNFWEKLVADHLKKLPKMSIKHYPSDKIFEFDYVEELRRFDEKYVKHSESKIMMNICSVFKCKENEIIGFKPIHEGLTNTSFIFTVKGKSYVYRQPGEGTDKIINRKHEKAILEFAKKYGFDPTFMYMNDEEGWKISYFVDEFKEPSYESKEDNKEIIRVLKKLHSIDTDEINWTFNPYQEALKLEEIIREKTTIQMKDFDQIKERITRIHQLVDVDGTKPCVCHCDTYKYNWMFTPNDTYLIDWEYAGVSDPGVDVGYYIVDAMYNYEQAKEFIGEYLGENMNEKSLFHYMGYVAIIAYYWFVWALYRETSGADMGESLFNWYYVAKNYSQEVLKEKKTLNRCSFDLLTYVDEHKNVTNDIRELSNELGYSWDTLKESIRECLDYKYLSIDMDKFNVTSQGYDMLSHYQVKRAIIMAAGFGSRMMPATADRPKPLVKVHGKRIIDTLLDALIAQDIKDIYIIRGYKKEKFDEIKEKYPFVNFIDNDDYDKCNNISSIMKALPYVDNTYICEADFMVSNPKIISKYHYTSDYLGAKVKETDDWCFRSLDGLAYDYKKGNINCYQAYGISYWNKADSKKIRKYIEELFQSEEGKQQFWEAVVFDYYKKSFKIEIRECRKSDIMEIDSYSELAQIDHTYQVKKN